MTVDAVQTEYNQALNYARLGCYHVMTYFTFHTIKSLVKVLHYVNPSIKPSATDIQMNTINGSTFIREPCISLSTLIG